MIGMDDHVPQDAPAAYRRLAALGPVLLTVADLVDPRAFKHRDHPLRDHFDVIDELFDVGDARWHLYDAMWKNLVTSELVPRLRTPVQVESAAHNAAFARFVDGLTENERSLPSVEVLVPPDVVANCCVATTLGTFSAPTNTLSTRASTLTCGMSALVGRRATVVLLGPVDEVVGTVVAVNEKDIVVAAHAESLLVIPLQAVAYVSTHQMTAAEEAAIDV